MKRVVMHIDVNNAFLSWTALELLAKGHFDIRDTYAVVGKGNTKRHRMVLAKSTSAKKMGVKTGDPFFLAAKKCPGLKMYDSNYELYTEMSNKFYKHLFNYSPDVEPASIDECYIEYTGSEKLFGDPVKFAYKIKQDIFDVLGFTVNIGVANNKLCAKMASNLEKPNRVHTMFEEEIESKMWPQPIENLFGVGKATAPKLKLLGINTIGDLANYDIDVLEKRFKNMGRHMKNIANGIDDARVIVNYQQKGIGKEITFIQNKESVEELSKELRKLSENVALSLRKKESYSSCISIVLKDSSFKVKRKQRKLLNATNLGDDIYKVSVELLKELWDFEPIRLIGIRLSHLSETNSMQVSLFEEVTDIEDKKNLQKILDNINDKYGVETIKRASFLKK